MSFLLVAQRALTVPGWVKNALWRAAKATPSLDLPFADSKSLVDAITGRQLISFTRASSGTFVGSAGVLQTAVTNLQRWSEDFTQGLTPNNATLTANQGTAPNGTLTADQFLETTANGLHSQEIADHTFIAGVTHTFSCYAKSIGGRNFGPGFPTLFGSARFGFFNLSGSGSVVSTDAGVTASIQSVGDGWYRCSITSTCATGGGARVGVFIASGTSISYAGDITKGFLLWGAQLEQSATVGEYIPTTSTINSAPRFDHNPTTGESLGLLVEEQRTNSIRNNTMIGAVAGTPGTLPTNWGGTTTISGLSRQIVAVGTVDGINYVRIRISGTASAPSVFFAVSTFDSTSASTGQTWTASSYYQLQAGSLTGVTLQHEIARFGVASAYLGSTVLPFAPGSSALIRQRYAFTTTVSDATLTAINYGLQMVVPTSGTVVDFTVDIGLPQLEQGAFATSVIPTTTAAATRSADVASITGSSFSSWYNSSASTIYSEAASSSGAAYTGNIYGFGTSFNDSIAHYRQVDFQPVARVRTAGVDEYGATGNGAIWTGTSPNKFALALEPTSGRQASNGALSSGSDDSSIVFSTVSSVSIGSAYTSGYFNGHIRRLTYWPVRLGNNVLQQITQ